MKAFLNSPILFIFITALAVRVGYIAVIKPGEYRNDSLQYHILAQNIARGNGFSLDENPPYAPTAYRPPGYSSFLAVNYLLFGESSRIIFIAQAVLSSITVVLIFLYATVLFNRPVGLVAAILAVLYPALIAYNGYLAAETLFAFLVMLMSYLLLQGEIRGRNDFIIWAGIMLGITNLVRPILLLYPFMLAAAYIFMKQSMRQVIVKVCLVTIMSLIVISPWIIRNTMIFDRLIPISVKGLSAFWTGKHAIFNYDKELDERKERAKKYLQRADLTSRSYDSIQKDRYMFMLGISEMLEEPRKFIKAFFYKIYILWRDPIGKNIIKQHTAAGSFIFTALYRVMLIFSAVGIWTACRHSRRNLLPLSIIIYVTLLHGMLHAIPRYHFPIIPFCIIFSVSGLKYVISQRFFLRSHDKNNT